MGTKKHWMGFIPELSANLWAIFINIAVKTASKKDTVSILSKRDNSITLIEYFMGMPNYFVFVAVVDFFRNGNNAAALSLSFWMHLLAIETAHAVACIL